MAIQRRTVIKHFKQHREEVIKYFDPCLTLLEDDYDYDVVVSYMFSRLENAHREILYYGIVVLHDVSTKLAYKAIDLHDLTRKDFKEKFSKVYGFDIPKSLTKKIESAEAVRDRILHGKSPETGKRAQAVLDTLEYFDGLDEKIFEKANIWIAGDRRGIKGAKTPLSDATSRWVLMGMGLTLS